MDAGIGAAYEKRTASKIVAEAKPANWHRWSKNWSPCGCASSFRFENELRRETYDTTKSMRLRSENEGEEDE